MLDAVADREDQYVHDEKAVIDRGISIWEKPSEREEGLSVLRELVRLQPEADNHQRPEDRLHRDGPKGDRLRRASACDEAARRAPARSAGT